MKKKTLIALCLALICAFALIACANETADETDTEVKTEAITNAHPKFVKMDGVELVDDGSGRYTASATVSSDEIVKIFNAGEWSSDNAENGGYDFKFIIDGEAVFYNSSSKLAVQNGKGMYISGDDARFVMSFLIETFSRKIKQDEVLKDSLEVVSGDARITPKRFFTAATYKTIISSNIGNVVNIDGSGCYEIYSYTQEKLATLPTIKLDGTLEFVLDAEITVKKITLTKIGREGAEDTEIGLDDISALPSGEYYICLDVVAQNASSIEDSQDVFKLIIE